MKVLLTTAVLIGIPGLTAIAGAADPSQFTIKIVQKQNLLCVLQAGKIIKKYSCSLGRKEGPKQRKGDLKTPRGKYTIIAWNQTSQFHFFLQLNYPNISDARRGYAQKLITKAQYEAIVEAVKNNKIPPQNTQLGGYIGLHGLRNGLGWIGGLHRLTNWTQGCIALTNEEIDDVKKYCPLGTTVIIE